MDITIVGPAHPYRGGIAQFNEKLAYSFKDEGDSVRIVNFTVQYPSFLFPGKTQYTSSPAPEGIVIQRSVSTVCPWTWVRTGRRIAREKPDMLIVRYWMPFFAPALGTIARIVSRNGHTKVLALTDNIVPHERFFFCRRLTRYFLNAVDGVVYMSKQVSGELNCIGYRGLKTFSPHPIYDIYGSPVDRTAACEKLGLLPKYRYVLFFGFIRDYKGLDLLLDAWSLIAGNGVMSKYKLLVAGEFYNDKKKYMNQIEKHSLQDRVILSDSYISDEEVKYYFSVADLLAQPYRSASQSGVTQIAYHFGVPMIVTDVGGLPEIVPHEKVGYVVEGNPEAIADNILKFVDSNKAEFFRANIEKEKERFQWNKLTGTFKKMLINLNSNKR